jgi:hypothetical protein
MSEPKTLIVKIVPDTVELEASLARIKAELLEIAQLKKEVGA